MQQRSGCGSGSGQQKPGSGGNNNKSNHWRDRHTGNSGRIMCRSALRSQAAAGAASPCRSLHLQRLESPMELGMETL
jgi:hypothetical protein